MYVYKITFYDTDGTTVVANGELVTDMTLATQEWTLLPAADGNLYSGTPTSPPPAPTWSAMPNYLNETTTVSVNILTSFVNPSTGVTLALAPGVVMPSGWAFSTITNLLTYDGVTVNSVPTNLSWIATVTIGGAQSTSPTIQVSGSGAPSGDTFAPTIPVGLAAGSITQTGATLTCLPSSDPAPSGITWSGLAGYTLTVPGVAGSPFPITQGPGNKPNLVFQDIGSPATPTTYSQSGADVSFTNCYANSSFTTGPDSIATAFQQMTGTGWVITCRIDAFVSSYQYAKVNIGFRNSMGNNDAYINVCCNPFSQGAGYDVEARTAPGLQPVSLFNRVANTTAPLYMMAVQVSSTQVAFYISFTGNLDSTAVALGTYTFNFASTFFGGGSTNTDPGQSVPYSVTLKQLNIQQLASISQVLSGLTANTQYSATITAKDGVPNVSAASSALTFTTQASSGNTRSKRTQPFVNTSPWNTPASVAGSIANLFSAPVFGTGIAAINGQAYELEFEFNLTIGTSSPSFACAPQYIYIQQNKLNWGSASLCPLTGTPTYNRHAGDALANTIPGNAYPNQYKMPNAYAATNISYYSYFGWSGSPYVQGNCIQGILLGDDDTVSNNLQFSRCSAGQPAGTGYSQDTPTLQGYSGYYAFSPSIKTGDGRFGSHGASSLSGLGGSLRLFDLQQGVIKHCLKLVPPHGVLYNGTTGYGARNGECLPTDPSKGYGTNAYRYVWPAYTSDGQAYGGSAGAVAAAGKFKMGSLLQVPSNTNFAGLGAALGYADGPLQYGFETQLGLIFLQCAVDYGFYVCDTTGGNPGTGANGQMIFPEVTVEPDATTGAMTTTWNGNTVASGADAYCLQTWGFSMWQYGTSRNGTGIGNNGKGYPAYIRDLDRIFSALCTNLLNGPSDGVHGSGGGTAIVPYLSNNFSD